MNPEALEQLLARDLVAGSGARQEVDGLEETAVLFVVRGAAHPVSEHVVAPGNA